MIIQQVQACIAFYAAQVWSLKTTAVRKKTGTTLPAHLPPLSVRCTCTGSQSDWDP